jgi:hypothetical protein
LTSEDTLARETRSGRPLVGTERALFTFSRLSPINLVVLVRLDGPVIYDLLPQALAALQERHPLLRARIAGPRNRPRFAVSRNGGQPAHGVGPIPLRILRTGDHGDANDTDPALVVVQEEMNTAFHAGRGPLARVTYIYGGTEAHDLVLTLNHAIADGTSTANLMHELLEWCGARLGSDTPAPPAKPPLPLPPPLTDLLPPSYSGIRRQQQSLKLAVSQARDEIEYRRGGRDSRHPVPAPGRAVTLAVSLDRESTTALVSRARRSRLTLTSVLSAALLWQANAQLYGGRPGTMRAIVWVDLRPHLNPPVDNETLGCYVSMLRFVIKVDPGNGFDSLADEVQGSIDHAARRGDRLPAAIMSAPLARIAVRWPVGRLGTTALSYAAVPPVHDSCGPLAVRDVRAFVSNMPLGAELAGASGVARGALWFNLLYLDSELSEETALKVGEGLLATLQGFADPKATQ